MLKLSEEAEKLVVYCDAQKQDEVSKQALVLKEALQALRESGESGQWEVVYDAVAEVIEREEDEATKLDLKKIGDVFTSRPEPNDMSRKKKGNATSTGATRATTKCANAFGRHLLAAIGAVLKNTGLFSSSVDAIYDLSPKTLANNSGGKEARVLESNAFLHFGCVRSFPTLSV